MKAELEMSKVKIKAMTWDDLADFYAKKTGGRARIMPMDDIRNWALKQPEITENKDTTLSLSN